MNNGEKEQLLKAIEQAARESFACFPNLTKYATNDEQAARHGAMNPRVAYILGWPGPLTLRRLKTLAKQGKVLQSGPSRKYGIATYWPVGLLEKIREVTPNVKVRGDAPPYGAASLSTAGLAGTEDV